MGAIDSTVFTSNEKPCIYYVRQYCNVCGTMFSMVVPFLLTSSPPPSHVTSHYPYYTTKSIFAIFIIIWVFTYFDYYMRKKYNYVGFYFICLGVYFYNIKFFKLLVMYNSRYKRFDNRIRLRKSFIWCK